VFPTEFAWYEVFAPDPVNPQHIIAADALNNKMMRSLNGGDDWFEMTQLTDSGDSVRSSEIQVRKINQCKLYKF
jgi:hypothetical protein